MSKLPSIPNSVKLILLFLATLLLFSIAWQRMFRASQSLNYPNFYHSSSENLSRKLRLLHESKNIVEQFIQASKIDTLFTIFNDELYQKLDNENICLLLYKKDSLIFWSSNKVPFIKYSLGKNEVKHRIIKEQNGWYFSEQFVNHNYYLIATIKIKNEFSLQNNFLVNDYLLADVANENILLSPNFKSGYKSFYHPVDKSYLFSFKSEGKKSNESKGLFPFLILFFAIILLVVWIESFVNFFIQPKNASLIFCALLLILRYCTLMNNEFLFWQNHIYFKPNTFAISVINPSLADYLINVLIIYFIVNSIFKNFSLAFLIRRLNQKISIFFSMLVVLLLSFVFTHYVAVLVADSNINYNFNNFSELSDTTFIAVSIIGLLCNIYFIVVSEISKQIIGLVSSKDIALLLVSLFFVWIVLLATQYNLAASNFFFIGILFWLFYIFNHSSFINTVYSKVVFIISVFAIWASIIINNQLISKKEQKAKLLAEKLAVEKDVVAENLFSEISYKIQNDSILASYLFKNDKQKQQFFKRLTEKYFNGYWDKFETRMYVYDVKCNQIAKSANATDEKLTVFEEVCSKKELESSAHNLFYVPSENDEDAGLFCKFIFNKTINNIVVPLTVYIQFTIKYNADEIGFPSLLLDKKIGQAKEKFNDFSYTKYRYNFLMPISKNNSFDYPLNSKFLTDADVKNQIVISNGFFNFEEYRHYFYKPYKSSVYLVSFKYYTFFEKLSFSSYLFAVFILLFLLKYVFENWNNLSFPSFDTLNKKIRVVLISSVFAGLLVLAGVTTYFLIAHFNSDKNEKLTENIQSLFIELENKFGDETSLSAANTEYYNYLLSKSSNVFFNDINLYGLDGNLIASSRFKIFDEGILNSKINASAFTALKFNNATRFINTEIVGKLSYISVYVPFVNNKNQLIGYIHLPFFDKENILKKDIFNLLATILNLYLILFVFIAVAAWWMTNKITFPLTVLKQRFADIDLGKSNAVIDWNANDEIGSVVKEYNNMVVQLNDSAAKLAQNQRELAWREMAKQVAHEIKNPLTPMKLNVQLLQRNLNLDEKTFKHKFENVAASLIEQIDSLANIANDFANFAHINKNRPEQLNLVEIVENVISLFEGDENIEIEFKHSHPQIIINADKDHLVRILNNLIKNSAQAETSHIIKKIIVELSLYENSIQLSVADNGNGIADEMKDKIFKPYFTTKTSGTGLGLAMVHQIVESMNGNIHFENLDNGGAKFIVELKI